MLRIVFFVFLLLALCCAVTAAPRSISTGIAELGSRFEPGEVITIGWSTAGTWQSDDTIRLDYSSDGGTTWNAIANASSLPYNLGSFEWDTTGCPESATYEVKATCNNRESIYGISDTFTIQFHWTPPTIVHAPLADSGRYTGPFVVRAAIDDDYGITSHKLYYRQNGGPWTSVDMTLDIQRMQECANIQATSGRIFDHYEYYIEAIDASMHHNVATYPAGAPGVTCSFNTIETGVDDVIEDQFTATNFSESFGGGAWVSNVYLCSVDSVLTKVEQYMDLSAATDVRVAVYESTTGLGGTYALLYDTLVPAVPAGIDYVSSGPMSVSMKAGRAYMIGVVASGPASFHRYGNVTSYPMTCFGRGEAAANPCTYVPAALQHPVELPYLFYRQRLTSTRTAWSLHLDAPNGGQSYQIGDKVLITWSKSGINWRSDDTLRLEYSPDGGSTWNQISGAQSLPNSTSTFTWNTAGLPDSDNYRVRVVLEQHPEFNDASDGNISLHADVQGPTVVVTPAPDTHHESGPYQVSATATDPHGIFSVTLYWRKNGGDYAPMVMSPVTGGYSASISTSTLPGDVLEYYVEAQDNSYNRNITRSEAYRTNILASGTDTVGAAAFGYSPSWYVGVGNVYHCTRGSVLTSFACNRYLNTAGASIRFQVYESASLNGTYRRIADNLHSNVATGNLMESSGTVRVLLVEGRYYAVCLFPNASTTFYYSNTGPNTTEFGTRETAVTSTQGSIPPSAVSFSPLAVTFHQTLTSSRVPRALAMTQDTKGKWFQLGEKVDVYLSAVGYSWQPGDTIRLEYSIDSGATWAPITGAQSLPYGTTTYTWDTTGYPESSSYRLRVVCNTDESVSDASSADFKVMADTAGPTITHAPLVDSCVTTNAFPVSATISDPFGVSSATLYWRKNGGQFAAVPITGGSASIPGGGALNDIFEYYIEARDGSFGTNVSRSPATGYHSFGVIESLAEQFLDAFNLSYTSVTFTPDGSRTFYSVTTRPIVTLPTDPTGGTVPAISGFYATVTLPEGKQIPFFGVPYSQFFAGNFGNVSFVLPALTDGSLSSFHSCPMIAAYYGATGQPTYKLLQDRVAVTYQDAIIYSVWSPKTTFQVEMFYDGRIRISYLNLDDTGYKSRVAGIAGLSRGFAPQNFVNRDFTMAPVNPVADIEVTDSIGSASDRTIDFGLSPDTLHRTARVTLHNNGSCEAIVDKVRLAPYAEDFSDGVAQGWKTGKLGSQADSPGWMVTGGEFDVSGSHCSGSSTPWISLYSWESYPFCYFEARVKIDAPGSTAGLIVYASDNIGVEYPYTGSGYLCRINPTAPVGTWAPRYEVLRISNGSMTSLNLTWGDDPLIFYGTWNTIGVQVNMTTLSFYLNGGLIGTVPVSIMPGRIGLYANSFRDIGAPSVTHFDDVFVSPGLNVAPALPAFQFAAQPTLPLVIPAGQSRDFTVSYVPSGYPQSYGGAMQFVLRGADESGIVVKLAGSQESPSGLPSARAAVDGNTALMSGQAVSAVFADRFYVQTQPLLGGMCVLWDGPMPAQGDHVTVYGKLVTGSGERMIRAYSVKVE